jgi:hypothetical protein
MTTKSVETFEGIKKQEQQKKVVSQTSKVISY